MARMPNPFGPARPYPMEYESAGDQAVVVSFFNMVYAWMAAGLALTGLVAWYVSTQESLMRQIFSPVLLIALFVVEIGLVIVISAAVNKLSATAATGLFLLYSAINGLLLSAIFVIYSMPSIAGTFVATAGTFAATSAYGMLTKRDLTRLGSLLFMALIGLIIASIVNIFWANSTLYWIITYAGVLIFVGLTAYDTQKLKQIAYATANDARMAARLAVNGALTLYLDFINLFLFMLRILGDRR